MNKLEVNIFYRKRFEFQFSIERIFNGIEEILEDEINISRKEMPHYNNTILGRFRNLLWAYKQKDKVNHITGEVHYIALGLRTRDTILTIHDLNFLERKNPISFIIYYFLWL